MHIHPCGAGVQWLQTAAPWSVAWKGDPKEPKRTPLLLDIHLRSHALPNFELQTPMSMPLEWSWNSGQGSTMAKKSCLPINTKLQNKEHMIEALVKVKFKFPGHQKNHSSQKRGLTKLNDQR